MSYIPHTEQDRRAMLAEIGVKRIEDLYDAVPEGVRFPELNLPDASNEMDIVRDMEALAGSNANSRSYACFLGAGAYDHYIPSVVDHILRRSEFYTAYTPYQPEISQGTLQAVFEYQSLICQLTGMDVANASLYDGATALAEAVSMALSHLSRKTAEGCALAGHPPALPPNRPHLHARRKRDPAGRGHVGR